MFEQGQVIMLMGSAETTDVASHLDPSKLEQPACTGSDKDAKEVSSKLFVIDCKRFMVPIILDFLAFWIEKFGKYMLCQFQFTSHARSSQGYRIVFVPP